MTNAYADLTTLKASAYLNISGTTYDTQLLNLLETVSRQIDRHANRHFYVLVTIRNFDGVTVLPVTDLISITTLKTDDDKDRTSEITWATSDYLLDPSSVEPTKSWGRPYSQVLVDLEAGTEDTFTTGRRTAEINGKWGLREVTEDSEADINEGGQLSATDTTLTVTDGAKFAVGQTIIIDSESLYITDISTHD